MSATPGTAPPPRRAVFPPTRSGVHLNLVFNYAVPDLRREIGVVDVVWGSRSPLPRQVFNQFYTPFERDGPYAGTHRLAWFERYHPDWIEYRCDRKTPAWESSSMYSWAQPLPNVRAPKMGPRRYACRAPAIISAALAV